MKQFFQKVPPIFKNFYFLSSLFFLVWMLFFDSNDLISQVRLNNKQEELESAKEFYESKIIEARREAEQLLVNQTDTVQTNAALASLAESVAQLQTIRKYQNRS